MIAGHSDDVAAVLGVSWPKDEAQATWLTRVQALDAMYIMRSYVGWAERGNPYMGVGRNLAIRRSAYPGFSNAPATASGDDDMVVQGSPARLTCALQLRRTGPRTWMWPCRPRGRIGWPRSADIGPQRRITKPRTSGGWPCRTGLRTGALVAAVLAVVVHNSLWITGGLLGAMWLGELLNPSVHHQSYQAPDSWRNRAVCFLSGRRGAHGSLCRCYGNGKTNDNGSWGGEAKPSPNTTMDVNPISPTKPVTITRSCCV